MREQHRTHDAAGTIEGAAAVRDEPQQQEVHTHDHAELEEALPRVLCDGEAGGEPVAERAEEIAPLHGEKQQIHRAEAPRQHAPDRLRYAAEFCERAVKAGGAGRERRRFRSARAKREPVEIRTDGQAQNQLEKHVRDALHRQQTAQPCRQGGEGVICGAEQADRRGQQHERERGGGPRRETAASARAERVQQDALAQEEAGKRRCEKTAQQVEPGRAGHSRPRAADPTARAASRRRSRGETAHSNRPRRGSAPRRSTRAPPAGSRTTRNSPSRAFRAGTAAPSLRRRAP